jgi:hypothetical protein
MNYILLLKAACDWSDAKSHREDIFDGVIHVCNLLKIVDELQTQVAQLAQDKTVRESCPTCGAHTSEQYCRKCGADVELGCRRCGAHVALDGLKGVSYAGMHSVKGLEDDLKRAESSIQDWTSGYAMLSQDAKRWKDALYFYAHEASDFSAAGYDAGTRWDDDRGQRARQALDEDAASPASHHVPSVDQLRDPMVRDHVLRELYARLFPKERVHFNAPSWEWLDNGDGGWGPPSHLGIRGFNVRAWNVKELGLWEQREHRDLLLFALHEVLVRQAAGEKR